MPDTITLENQASLGLRLVSMLTSQLKGTVTIDRSEGTKFVFTIPNRQRRNPGRIPGKERDPEDLNLPERINEARTMNRNPHSLR